MSIRRAVVQAISVDSHNGSFFGNLLPVNYVCAGQADTPLNVAFQVPLDASPREILDAVVLAVIANQPSGFDLHPHDIIIPSIERG